MISPWCEVKQKPQHISVCGNDIEVTNCRQVRFLGVFSHLHMSLGNSWAWNCLLALLSV